MHDGYEQATVRAIAADAGVDVAMVYYFFDSKDGLINAAALTGPPAPAASAGHAPRTRGPSRSGLDWCVDSLKAGMQEWFLSHL